MPADRPRLPGAYPGRFPAWLQGEGGHTIRLRLWATQPVPPIWNSGVNDDRFAVAGRRDDNLDPIDSQRVA